MHCRTPILFSLLALALHWQGVSAATGCDVAAGRFVSIEGVVEVQAAAGGDWRGAVLETSLCEGDTIRVGERSRAAVALINEAVLRIDQGTTLRLLDITAGQGERSWLELVKGAIQSFSRKPRFLTVNTPYLNGSIEGTEFTMRVEEGSSQITVFEGVVTAANDQGKVAVSPGESASASAGQAPQRRTVVRPRDQVQWSLYYPPILSASAVASGSPALSEAAACAERGDTTCAFAALDRVPVKAQDARFSLLRASLLLSVGRVKEARSDIDAALAQDPGYGLAYALRSVIAVALNDRQQALADAKRGVELSPDSAAAKIALSYALQAEFQIETARDTMRAAVEQRPQDALAWARLAELELMLGHRSQALDAAQRAQTIAPNLARTELVLGFNALAVFRNAEAKSAFERAIASDSADPLAHLGLGLAKISDGKLDDGRRDLEAAVGLDSKNSLLRAYLGKAYFEEKRGPLDAQQFEIAKELDPLDPTAYLYNAIRLQTENQPIAALRDINASIERNDNRAVYRSRLLLDKDRATRAANLAQIYRDLGFTRSGVEVARSSITLDPSNASGHRFLSESYGSVRRREISRVSELLQAQMLQDVNINPVQPSVSETNLNTLTRGGPASVGYNEFTPLFERNTFQVDITGLGGNNGTAAGEGVVTALYNRFSLSAGYYDYETDGWRPNNGLRQDISNIYAQVALTPELNVQAEYRRRNSTEGDLAFNFDPEDFIQDKSIGREQETARVGLRYSPSPSSNVLLSYIHGDRTENLRQTEPLDPFTTASAGNNRNDRGYQAEAQYIYQGDRFNVVAGLSYSNVDVQQDTAITIETEFLPFPLLDIAESTASKIEHPRGYVYTNVRMSDSLVATLGASYDDYQEDPVSETSFNPKIGFQWNINEVFSVRAAAFRIMKPALVNNRTLEPTQVAGFNQFFDDINGTKSTRYGIGFDWSLTPDLLFGGELTWRDLDEPTVRPIENDVIFEGRQEELHRAYLYWTPHERIAVTTEFVYDRWQADQGIATEFDNVPELVETISLPLGVTYYLPNGLSAGIAGTYVDQRVQRSELATQADGSDNFFVVDASLAYRLPKRFGTVALQVRNLFDQQFEYQDDSYREFRDEPSTGPYFPETTFWAVARVTL